MQNFDELPFDELPFDELAFECGPQRDWSPEHETAAKRRTRTRLQARATLSRESGEVK